ncbi:MAG: M15 family metallopeptidase [Clostridia bacterium]|nr:M15 family metallopeptidase [Clostridia bacterium]
MPERRLRQRLIAMLLLALVLSALARAEAGDAWMLILVNREHPLPDGYQVTELVEVRGGQKVDRRIYPALQNMFDAARSSGLQVVVRSGYRTRKQQEQMLLKKYNEYLKKGNTDQKVRELALAWVAYPGTSEHEAGLGVDINAASGSSKNRVYSWLSANAWKYGFVLRYPESKTHITGIINEPWHYRYVGTEAAADMQQTGLCLEEYLLVRALAENRPLE